MFFFFFEQKTAYEMRISDWSSDVCSSDLSSLRSACVASVEPLPGSDSPNASVRQRSEERRVGKECVCTCRSRWSPYHTTKKEVIIFFHPHLQECTNSNPHTN